MDQLVNTDAGDQFEEEWQNKKLSLNIKEVAHSFFNNLIILKQITEEVRTVPFHSFLISMKLTDSCNSPYLK